MLKKLDIPALQKKYAEDPATQAAIRQITSPTFLQQVSRDQEHVATFVGESLKTVLRQSPMIAMAAKQVEKLRNDLTEMIAAQQPSLQRLAGFSAATAGALSRDLEALGHTMEQIDLSRKASAESIVTSLSIESPLEIVTLPPAMLPRKGHVDDVTVSKEYFLELLAAHHKQKGKDAATESHIIEEQKLTAWTGDQPLSYDGKELCIGSQKAKVPKEGDATNRTVLLIKLVEDYNSEKSIGVDSVTFMQELRRMQIRPSARVLETAGDALNKEIEAAFKIRKLVKVSRSVAKILRKGK